MKRYAKVCGGGLVLILILLMAVEWLRRAEFPGLAIPSLRATLVDVVLTQSTQVPIVTALLIYFVALLWIAVRNRKTIDAPPRAGWRRLTTADLLRIGIVALSFVACMRAWTHEMQEANLRNLQLGIDQTTNALVLLTGVVLSCAADGLINADVNAARAFRRIVLVCVTIFLAATSFFHPDVPHVYRYHGAIRWTGLWVNPNTYGLLMGVGFLTAICLVRLNFKGALGTQPAPSGRHRIRIAFWTAALVLCGFGLLKSYSRGAWLATACGLVFLAGCGALPRIRRNGIPVGLALASLFVLAFWQFRFTDVPLARRVFSVGNINDFSWRNRVTVWTGGARMLAARPLAGFGWGRVEEAYQDYRAARLDETMAIQLNDFLTLGISAGLPVLMCFVAYAGISLCPNARRLRRSESGAEKPPDSPSDFWVAENGWLLTATRASCVLLLVGFWFDGGLFRLATGPLFWILAELSRSGTTETRSVSSAQLLSTRAAGLRKGEIALRVAAGFLVVLAVAQTGSQLLIPRLNASQRNLALARRFLVHRSEINEFDYLASNPIWDGKRVGTLMEHIRLSRYNRKLVPWQMDDQTFSAFVLSPQIDPAFDGDLDWRRPLWEYLYPRVRHDSDEFSAAETVGSFLRSRVTISNQAPQSVSGIWAAGISGGDGFERIYVAALRSVGIAAQLGSQGKADLRANGRWRPAPGPVAPTPASPSKD